MRPLAENSSRWRAQKEREGRPTSPLQYKGGLRNPSYYDVIVENDVIIISLIPSYRQIHLDLIEISEATGKNYKDWFGIAVTDIKMIVKEFKKMIGEILEEFFG
jgi:hypothetical protein